MQLDERLYKTFLEELNSLENFRIAYRGIHPQAPLDSDDPDVKRLTEAIAFFAARTRLAAIDNVFALQRRIFSQFFPFLMTPLPATGILRASTTGQFVESLVLPKGTTLAVSTQTGKTAYFDTTRELRIIPIALTEMKMLLMPGEGFRLLLHFRASYPRNEDIDWLSLHINHLNDFMASLLVFHTLRECLKTTMVVFGDEVSETSRGPACDVFFGAPRQKPDEVTEETLHPIMQERGFFHYPHQELYLNVRVPPPPRNWQRFTLILDLTPRWPRNLVLNREIFQLFTVPVFNCRRSMATPIVCDGTQERNPIRYPKLELGFDLHSVLGVYEVKKNHMEPLRPGILAGGNGSYEIVHLVDGPRPRPHVLKLYFPEAFQAPRTIAVDALWVQPWFSEHIQEKHQITLFSRSAVGLRWEWLGELVPQAENPYLQNTDGIFHVLSLTNKSSLNYANLTGLLVSMGIGKGPPFSRAMQNIAAQRVEETVPRKRGSSQILTYVYTLQVKNLDPSIRPLMEIFVEHLGRLVDAWIPDVAVEVRLELAQ